MSETVLTPEVCKKARLARDPRFDGQFFTAVKTTNIYCRSICPAPAPKEENVTYFPSAIAAANEGYRPCLRCRPDSAPQSPAWKGVDTTVERAIDLIHQGALQQNSLPELAERLGISDRYLRKLFKKTFGVSPKKYALYQQCLFAKQLLHQTQLPITEVALASGFNSVRRFNDYFQKQLKLTPSQVRRTKKTATQKIQLQLHYRPPYDWDTMYAFLQARIIPGLEWCDNSCYGRTFLGESYSGYFTAEHVPESYKFVVTIVIDDLKYLKPITYNIRRILDLDVDIVAVENSLQDYFSAQKFKSGLRLPGIWNVFEAGVRAILGQQVSVTAARKLVTTLVHQLGDEKDGKYWFPLPQDIANSDLAFFKMPASRKQTLYNLSNHQNINDPSSWLPLKGIGLWTVDYARMRGLSDPDIYLAGDLGIKKARDQLPKNFDPSIVSPWRSYLTLHLWSQL